jgi:hypothetical protein
MVSFLIGLFMIRRHHYCFFLSSDLIDWLLFDLLKIILLLFPVALQLINPNLHVLALDHPIYLGLGNRLHIFHHDPTHTILDLQIIQKDNLELLPINPQRGIEDQTLVNKSV